MDREALERPFPPDQIKHRKGNFNRTLAYLESHTVIQRLNDGLDAAWSFEVLSHEVLQEEVLVLGKLTAESITQKELNGGSVTRFGARVEFLAKRDVSTLIEDLLNSPGTNPRSNREAVHA